MSECVEVVQLRPKPGALDRLLEIRPRMVKGLMDSNPAIHRMMLLRADKDALVDVVWWRSRAAAESSLASHQGETVEAFRDWSAEIDAVVSVIVTDILADAA